MNEFLRFIHDEYAAANKRNAENRKLTPYQRCDPVQIIYGTHGSNVRTYSIEGCLLYGVTTVSLRLLKIHVSPECEIDNRCKTFQDFCFVIFVSYIRPCIQTTDGK